MTVEKSLYSSKKPNLKETIRLASESAEEEAQMELDSLLLEFEEWQKENSGGWKDFLKSHKSEPKVIRLKNGGPVKYSENSFEQLADDYNDGIGVIEIDGEKESFSNYIKRMGGVKDD